MKKMDELFYTPEVQNYFSAYIDGQEIVETAHLFEADAVVIRSLTPAVLEFLRACDYEDEDDGSSQFFPREEGIFLWNDKFASWVSQKQVTDYLREFGRYE